MGGDSAAFPRRRRRGWGETGRRPGAITGQQGHLCRGAAATARAAATAATATASTAAAAGCRARGGRLGRRTGSDGCIMRLCERLHAANQWVRNEILLFHLFQIRKRQSNGYGSSGFPRTPPESPPSIGQRRLANCTSEKHNKKENPIRYANGCRYPLL